MLFSGKWQIPDRNILWLVEIFKDHCILQLVSTQFPFYSRVARHWIVMPEWLWCSNSVSVFVVRLKRKRKKNKMVQKGEKGLWAFLSLSPIHINIGAIQVENKGERGNDNNASFWKSKSKPLKKNVLHENEQVFSWPNVTGSSVLSCTCAVLYLNRLCRGWPSVSGGKPSAFHGQQIEPGNVATAFQGDFPVLVSSWGMGSSTGWNANPQKQKFPLRCSASASCSSSLLSFLAGVRLLQLARTCCYKSHVNFPVNLGLV